MKAVQTRCPQRALQVLSEGRLVSTTRSNARLKAQRKDRECRRLGGGERTASGRAAPPGDPDLPREGDRTSMRPALVAGGTRQGAVAGDRRLPGGSKSCAATFARPMVGKLLAQLGLGYRPGCQSGC